MRRILLFTDDHARSACLVHALDATVSCQIHDLQTSGILADNPDALLVDVSLLDAAMVLQLRRLLAPIRRGLPLIILLHQNSPRARLQAIALGATQTLSAPHDLRLLRAALCTPAKSVEEVPTRVWHQANAARQFYSAVFVADQPITQVVVDNGTNLVEQAIQEGGIRDWIRAVHRFDDATHQHCLLVAGLAAAFAALLGLGLLERHRLTRAALLHDVGKIHVPAAILNKPGKLDAEEMALVRLHPEQGEAILAGQGFDPELLAVVRSHHEMLDGSGYPDRLSDSAIPDLVRLITICDIYGALIERRSYKLPMAPERAYAILTEMKGRLDPVLVNAFQPISAAFPDIVVA